MIGAGSRPLYDQELRQPALIVAPHPDDETLGCGGTIIRKIAVGAAVHVVFTTDGGGSHRGIDRHELVRRRADEAIAACAVLGVAKSHITFLALADGRLEVHQPDAARRMAKIMRDIQPQQVFAPYRHDNHPDHLATNRAVVAALGEYGRSCVLLEYPVWFWEHWPWMKLPPWLPHRRRRAITRAVLSPLRAWRDIRRFVDVADVLEQKKDALAEHATQMRAMADGWTTLGEISGGEFLDRLLTAREIFAERRIG